MYDLRPNLHAAAVQELKLHSACESCEVLKSNPL